MTAHIPESDFAWPAEATNMMPPRDPNDNDDEDEGNEPAVIREPDDDEPHTRQMRNSPISRIQPQIFRSNRLHRDAA